MGSKTNKLIYISIALVLALTLFLELYSIYAVGNNWEELPVMPENTADGSAVAYNDTIYYFGGYHPNASIALNIAYKYNTTDRTYTQKTNMSTARWGPIAVRVNDTVYVIGGEADGIGQNKNEAYNLISDTWTPKNNSPAGISHQGLMGVEYNRNVYLFYKNYTYIYHPSNDTYSSPLASMPTSRTWATAAVYGSDIYIVGGYSYDIPIGATNVVEVYNTTTNTWSSKTSAPLKVYGTIRESPIINGKIYHMFGQRAHGEFFRTNQVYNITSERWDYYGNANHSRDGLAGCVVNGKIYALGGRVTSPVTEGLNWSEVYNPSNEIAITHPELNNFYFLLKRVSQKLLIIQRFIQSIAK